MDKKIISKIFDEILCFSHHISNDEIREKVSAMSVDERKKELSDKLNPFEKEDYDDCLRMIDFLGMNKHPNDYVKNLLKETKEQLFEYDKRIIRGYDLDKYKDNVSKYNINDFQTENTDTGYAWRDETSPDGVWELEYNQVLEQRSMVISDGGVNALKGYFYNDYKYINGDLNKNYNQSAWKQLSDTEQKEHHAHNLESVRELDKVINDSNGLVVDTILFHGTNNSHLVDNHTRIGEQLNLKQYISTSFIEHTGKGYSNDGGFLVRFLAPKGTRGVCANDLDRELTNYHNEHEYLLGRNNKGTVVDIDYDNRMFTVLLE